MTRDDWAKYNVASECIICHESLHKENFKEAVEVYDPNTDKYAGLVHWKIGKCYSNALKTYVKDQATGELEELPFVGPRDKGSKK